MLTKAALLGILLASTPFCFVATTTTIQDPQPEPSEVAPLAEIDTLRTRYADELARMREQLTQARGDLVDLRGELEESLDMLVASWQQRHNSCKPSRALLTQYQWLDQRGHRERANKALALILKRHGGSSSSMNSLAWSLMTDKDTAGKYDHLALALTERMQSTDHDLSHQQTDTAALAKFLNGKIREAISLQRKAVAACGSDDYRRRLRTYEVACEALAAQHATVPVTAAPDAIDDDEPILKVHDEE